MANDNIQANSEKKVVIELDNVRRDFLVGEETVHALKGVKYTKVSLLPSWVNQVQVNLPC